MSHADKDDVKNIFAGKSFFILYIFIYVIYIFFFYIFYFSIFLIFNFSIFLFFYVCCALIRMIARARVSFSTCGPFTV